MPSILFLVRRFRLKLNKVGIGGSQAAVGVVILDALLEKLGKKGQPLLIVRGGLGTVEVNL
jgi:hypothetical protein